MAVDREESDATSSRLRFAVNAPTPETRTYRVRFLSNSFDRTHLLDSLIQQRKSFSVSLLTTLFCGYATTRTFGSRVSTHLANSAKLSSNALL